MNFVLEEDNFRFKYHTINRKTKTLTKLISVSETNIKILTISSENTGYRIKKPTKLGRRSKVSRVFYLHLLR